MGSKKWQSNIENTLNVFLTLFEVRGRHYGPDNHEKLLLFYRIRAKPPKISSSLCLNLSHLWNSLLEIFEKSKREKKIFDNFDITKKIENFKNSYFAKNHTFSF